MKGKVLSFFQSVKKKAIAVCIGCTTAVAVSAVAFAAEGDALPTIAITQDMLTPLVTGVVSNIGVILPVGLALFAIFLGVRLIPGIITSFVKMR